MTGHIVLTGRYAFSSTQRYNKCSIAGQIGMTSKSSPWDVLLWFALAGAWSSSFAVIKIGVATIDPAALVAGRMAVAALAILTIFTALGHRLSRKGGDWLSYCISGLLGSVVPFLLITYGEQSVESALAAILMGISPLATALLATWILPDERLTWPLVAGLLGALCGVALLVGPGALAGLGAEIGGQAAIFAAALCYACSTIYIRRFVTRPPLEMAAGSALVGTGVILLAALAMGADFTSLELSAGSAGAVLYLGLVSTAGANLTYFYLVPRLGANRMSQVNFAVPVGGALLGAVLLGEALALRQIAALVLIVGSVWLATRAAQRGRQA